ncbi:MAG: transaldolase [Acidimicrobiia bacterium]|nr:transaldolase [Acidimicrobiia bacterium]
MTESTNLHALFADQGQSPWLDNLRRSWVENGELQEWVDRGVLGITSNPSIFQKAIEGSEDYTEQFVQLLGEGRSIEESYWGLVVTDIESALELMRPTYDATNGLDGYVSVEVDPGLAREQEGTEAAARVLWDTIDEPNLYVKIPATAEGVPAIEQMIAEKRSINVTLLFSVERYKDVMEAYIAGLEAAEGDLSAISSVASFFISRVDVEVDKRLEAIGTEDALALRGKAAIANGKLAYAAFLEIFSGPRWDALVERGARVQRPLWASTSTKNPEYPDTLYVDELIGPNTVNTIPDSTLGYFLDHGTVARTLDADMADAHNVLAQLAAVGVDLDDVAVQLEDEGVASFEKSFDDLLASLEAKAATLK